MNAHKMVGGPAEAQQPKGNARNVQHGKLVSGGRLQIPADMRRALGLNDGDAVTMEVVDGRLHVRPYRAVLAEIQAQFVAALPPGVTGASIVDEFIAERRAEAERE
jgi:AbrB family looped-hinge helix DNA binding protein